MTVEPGLKGGLAVARTEPRLQVWRTVVEAYALTLGNLGYLLRISWAWVLLMTPVSLAFYASMFWLSSNKSASYFVSFQDVSSTLLFQPFLASVAVAWHRRLLMNEVWRGRVYMQFDQLVASYFGLAVVILFLFQGPVIFLGPMIAVIFGAEANWPVWLILIVAFMTGAGLLLSTKIWLTLPARALGNSEITVRQAWRRSRRNVWRLIAGSALSSVPFVALLFLATIFATDSTEVGEPLVYATWQTLNELGITFLAGVPIVSFLAAAYRRLIQDRSRGST